MVAVKVGRGIGCGIIVNGGLYRGSVGAAGDISHVRISGLEGEERSCQCGNLNCLETVASGAAILTWLAAEGQPAKDVAEVAARVKRADRAANLAVRSAGGYLGEVLAIVVNFFNPEVLLLGGVLGEAEPLVAAVRAGIYQRCLPMASEAVQIVSASAGPNSTLIGAAALILDGLTTAVVV